MRHKDLFSGIGGFSLAARMVWGSEHQIVLFCEKEPYARKVLNKNFPGVPCVEDIRELRGEPSVTTDIVTAGFPCQPFSVAGKRAGQQDDRYLWPETLRFIQEDRPRWFIGENVPGIINLALDDVLASLESAGYTAETFIIPACAVNAPHRRNRIWIVANAKSAKCEFSRNTWERRAGLANGDCHVERVISDAESEQAGGLFERRFPANISASRDWTRQTEAWATQPGICGVADGVSHRVDRLRGLGNAIVPHVAAVLMAAIKEVDRVYNNVLQPTERTGGKSWLQNSSVVAARPFGG